MFKPQEVFDYITELLGNLKNLMEISISLKIHHSVKGGKSMNGGVNQILAVDDNPSNLTLINGILSDTYKVYPVDSGAMALKFLSKRRPDLILLDVEMPVMSGTDLLRSLKSNPDLSGIPVIFLTGTIDLESEASAYTLGAADYIHKPINGVILRHKVKLHLELKTLRESSEAAFNEGKLIPME